MPDADTFFTAGYDMLAVPDHLHVKDVVVRTADTDGAHHESTTVKKPRERTHRHTGTSTGKATGVFEGNLMLSAHLILGKFTHYHYKPSYIFLGSSGFSDLLGKRKISSQSLPGWR